LLKIALFPRYKGIEKDMFDVTALMEWHSAKEPTANIGKPVTPPAVEENLVSGSGGRLETNQLL